MPAGEMAGAIASHPSGSALTLTVVPRSSRNRLERLDQGQLRARITAAPTDGAANAALLKFLAREFGLPRSRLSILSGETSRTKRILIEGFDRIELVQRLEAVTRAHD